MEKRKLGTTDIEVPVICLGTMTWGQQNSEAEAHEQLDYATSVRGLTFLDTAEMYPVPPEAEKQGTTEKYIGSWLQKRGKRDDLFIASKVCAGHLVRTRPFEGERPIYDKKNIETAIDDSLERLQTDYLDLYQIHWPERQTNFFGIRGYESVADDGATEIEETLTVLAGLVKAGKVRHIGVSNETPWGITEYLRLAREKGLPRIVSTQNQYSLTNRTYEIGLSEITMKEDVSLLGYSPLNMGVLTGKYLDGVWPEGTRFTQYPWYKNITRYNPARAQVAIKRFVNIAQRHGLDPATLAIAFACSREFMTSVIIGATSMEQLKVCIDAGEVELTPEILTEIGEVYEEMPDMTH